MNKLLGIVMALVALAVVNVNAQSQYEIVNLQPNATQDVAASATSNFTATAYVGWADWVAVFTSHKLTGTGTDNTVIKLAHSIDGVTWEDTPQTSITVANTGVTSVETVTQVQTKGTGWLKLASIANGDTGDALTNIVVKVGIKKFN